MEHYMDLNVSEEALQVSARGLSSYAPEAGERLDEIMLAIVSAADDVGFEQWLTDCRQWLYVLGLALDEYRTSLVYAAAILDSIDPTDQDLVRRTGRAKALGYFLENAALRAFSVAEKAAQLINVFLGLGLKEKREVDFDRVKRLVTSTSFRGPLEAMAKGLKETNELRHAHAHRFDPGIVRSKVEPVRLTVTGTDVVVRLWTMVERPISFGDELTAYSRAHAILDGALRMLFEAMETQLGSGDRSENSE